MPANKRWETEDVLESLGKNPYPEIDAVPGLDLVHTGSNTRGVVAGFAEGDRVVIRDEDGNRHVFRAHDGAFTHGGKRVALRAPKNPQRRSPSLTPSGSVSVPAQRARVARASRIWVEGLHDAELLEKVWGDDLRAAGIVVEPMHGADDLEQAVATFNPNRGARLGILLDHMVAGSKERRLADGVGGPDVLICGHPYVDVWAAIKPSAAGLDAWPDVPHGIPWKDGVLDALGVDAEAGTYWKTLLDRVESYRDLETPLVNAVERLIDFVTAE